MLGAFNMVSDVTGKMSHVNQFYMSRCLTFLEEFANTVRMLQPYLPALQNLVIRLGVLCKIGAHVGYHC